ncbi:MAG: SpoIIE family protein phosphatase [Bacilli bacterium]|nr:SpoIIE family protein phosphatase [Bacilli bacterium]
MTIKEWIKTDYSEVEDPSYKNELKANKFLGITLFFIGVISLLCLIFQLTGVFHIKAVAEIIIFFSVLIFFSLTGCLIAYLTNGKKPYVRFALLFDVIVIAIAADMFLSFYGILFLAVPFICVSRYANRKLSIRVSIAILVMVLINGFLAFFTNVQYDLNVLPDSLIASYIENRSALSYWEYTEPIMLFSVLPKQLILALIGLLTVGNASSVQRFTKEEARHQVLENRINGELAFAKSLQESMLPVSKNAFPNVDCFTICGSMIPAKEIGGDLYDYFLIDDQHLAIVIGDVSGKGVPASLFMGMSRIIIKNMLLENINLEDAVAKINDMLCRDNKFGLFVTSWIGVLDLHSGDLTYVNAGHNFPILCKNNVYSFMKEKSGIALGVVNKKTYKQYKVNLKPNDRLLIYTDGVTEAVNLENELYSENRLIDFVKKHNSDDEELIADILSEIKTYQEGREQFDDITIVSLTFKKYLNKKNVKKEFPALVESFTQVSEFIEETLTDYEIDLKFINQINIAVEEIFTNIAKYGFKGIHNGKVTVDITFVNKEVTITTYDNSPKFDPFSRKDPDITLTAEDRPIGGLGIFMVKKLMDEVNYKYENDTNVISIKKKIYSK